MSFKTKPIKSSGINSLQERIIILDGAKMDYTQNEIAKFIEMWNEGRHVGDIANYFWINNYEVALLAMHCEIEEWIQPREGGLSGSLPRKKRDRKKVKE